MVENWIACFCSPLCRGVVFCLSVTYLELVCHVLSGPRSGFVFLSPVAMKFSFFCWSLCSVCFSSFS